MKAPDLDTLDEDLPTTAEDVKELRRARQAARMTPGEIVRTLERLGTLSPAEMLAAARCGMVFSMVLFSVTFAVWVLPAL